jgi:hypothetical protein
VLCCPSQQNWLDCGWHTHDIQQYQQLKFRASIEIQQSAHVPCGSHRMCCWRVLLFARLKGVQNPLRGTSLLCAVVGVALYPACTAMYKGAWRRRTSADMHRFHILRWGNRALSVIFGGKQGRNPTWEEVCDGFKLAVGGHLVHSSARSSAVLSVLAVLGSRS